MQCLKCQGSGKLLSTGQIFTCDRCAGAGVPVPFYAGIGSRATPAAVGREMQAIAMQLAMRGYALRSGGAKQRQDAPPDTVSADLEFEKGCNAVGGRKIIRLPTHWEPALEHARRYHPTFDELGDHVQALHARNSLIVMGDTLDQPVAFVVCWTPAGMVTGGTGQALRIAHAESIPRFNLAVQTQAALWAWLDGGSVV